MPTFDESIERSESKSSLIQDGAEYNPAAVMDQTKTGGGVVSERLSSELNNRESGGAGSRCLDTREAVVDPNIVPQRRR